MASNTSVVVGADGEQTTDDSSPVVSVDSCDDRHVVKSDSDTSCTSTSTTNDSSLVVSVDSCDDKHVVKSDSDTRRTTTSTTTDSFPIVSKDSCDDKHVVKSDSDTMVSVDSSDDKHAVKSDSDTMVSVDSSNDKHVVKSDSDTRRTTTPVIREPSQLSDKSTPVSPMDNAFFPGPDKWWYQKECEQRGAKKGSFLDLEPNNWWGCRRHSEADIIGIPPQSPDRRHSATPVLSHTKSFGHESKRKEKREQTKDICDSSSIDESDGCAQRDSLDDDDIFGRTDKEHQHRLDPPKSGVIDLSDVDEEQESIPEKDGNGIGSEQSYDVDKSCFDEQIDCHHVELADVNVDCEMPEVTAESDTHHEGHLATDQIDQQEYSASCDNETNNLQDSECQPQTDQLHNQADTVELQCAKSTDGFAHDNEHFKSIQQPFEQFVEIQEPNATEDNNNQTEVHKKIPLELSVLVEKPEKQQSVNIGTTLLPLIVVDSEQTFVSNENKTTQTPADVLGSEIEISAQQDKINVEENISEHKSNSETVREPHFYVKEIESCKDEIDGQNVDDSHLSKSSLDKQSGFLTETSKDFVTSSSSSGQSLKPEEDQNVEEMEELLSYSTRGKSGSLSKENKTGLEITQPLASRDTYISESGLTLEPTRLSQRLGKGKLDKDPTVLVREEKRTHCVLEDSKWNSFKIFISICVLLLLLGYLVLSSILSITISLFLEDHAVHSNPSKPFRECVFNQHLKHLEEDFPSQSPILWNVIGGAALKHIQDPPLLERPVVLLLAGLPNSESTTGCLATKLGAMFDEIFQSSQHHIVVNGSLYKDESADNTKIKIDETLKSHFQSGWRCAIIHNLDSIPPCAILLFHNYCENDNAPFKDVAILHTIQLQQSLEDLGELERPKDYDRVVSNHLRSIWEACPDLTEDKQNAMLSRVANNVIIVKGETQDQLSKVCS